MSSVDTPPAWNYAHTLRGQLNPIPCIKINTSHFHRLLWKSDTLRHEVKVERNLSVTGLTEQNALPYGSAARPSPLEYGVVIFLFVITLAVALLTWTPNKTVQSPSWTHFSRFKGIEKLKKCCIIKSGPKRVKTGAFIVNVCFFVWGVIYSANSSLLMTGIILLMSSNGIWCMRFFWRRKTQKTRILVSSQAVLRTKQCNHWHREQRKQQKHFRAKAFKRKSKTILLLLNEGGGKKVN